MTMVKPYSTQTSIGTSVSVTTMSNLMDEDEKASLLSDVLMRQQQHGDMFVEALAERASLISSVNWLGSHLPFCVLDRLGQDITLRQSDGGGDEHDSSSTWSVEDSTDDFSQESQMAMLAEIRALNVEGQEEEDFNGSCSAGSVSSLQGEEINLKQPQSTHRPLNTSDASLAESSQGNSYNTSIGDMSELSADGKSEDWKKGEYCNGNASGILPEIDGLSGHPQHVSSRIMRPLPDSSSQKSHFNYPGLPYASTHECALLFVDISGFTKLSTLLDPESLSKTINAYFQLIVNQVTAHGGDVLKFAGDSLFAEWQVSTDDNDDPSSVSQTTEQRASLAECVAVAATCGAKIVNECSDYPVFMNGQSGLAIRGAGEQVAALNVHCGLGAGKITGVHVGDNTKRREYLILGDPIDQVSEAADAASLGELLASPEALEVMIKSCKMLNKSKEDSLTPAPTLIARNNLSGFTPRLQSRQHRCHVIRMLDDWDTDLIKEYRKLICLYAHPVIVDNELNAGERVTSTAQQRHSEEAELRTVYVLFISMPRVRVNITGDADKDEELFTLLNRIMNITTCELDRFHGHLRQFIVDDKGLVIIATFGLRGSTSPNIVTERGLPATIAIHNSLQNELGVFNRVGGTVGNAYCGVVGGVERHEYAVMGPSVNLAARLMCSPINPGILVDEAVRLKAGKAFTFQSLAPVKAKGYSEPVPIFQPLSSLERRWGRIKSDFVGRKEETAQILEIARKVTCNSSHAKIILLEAESGTGKSTLVVHSIDQLRSRMGKDRRSLMIAKHVCRESDILVPFSMFRSVLMDILIEMDLIRDDKSLGISPSGDSKSSGSCGSDSLNLEWDLKSQQSGLSRASIASTCCSSDHFSRILAICDEINAPPEFVDLIGHHLLGIEMANLHGTPLKVKKAPNVQTTINFMHKIFQRCTKGARLTVLALDDVHQMDEMSWRVIKKLYSSTRNLLIICTSRPLSKNKLMVDSNFLNELTGRGRQLNRFISIKLKRLEVDDIKQMIAKNLGIEDRDICEDFQKDVFTQSRGMPHFASEILSSAKRRNSIGMVGDMFGWTAKEKGTGTLSHASVGDIVVARLDSFDASVRNALNLGAVIGLSFELADVIAITQHFAGCTSRKEKVGQAKKCIDALAILVAEGIMIESCLGGDAEQIDSPKLQAVSVSDAKSSEDPSIDFPNSISDPCVLTNKSYQFCHDIWRSSILMLMLDSRKKHIHRTFAQILEHRQKNDEVNDYSSQMKIFSHWRSAGESAKAGMVALAVGKCFEGLGLHDQCITLYEDTLSLWRDVEPSSDDGRSGLSEEVLANMNVVDLEFIIKVHVAMGQCFAAVHRGADSVVTYQTALQILQSCPCADRITDRSLVFPIFSGLFLALKFGQIEQDEECTYEQNIVERFVYETKLNQDPIHYARALAMQAEMFGRLRNYDRAFEVFEQLKVTYNVDEHTIKISEAYGSDCAGQCFPVTCLWLELLGRKDDALAMCEYIYNELMPKMDARDVHNACIMLYPTIWAMKDANRSLEVLDLFIQYVVNPFDKYYGEGAFTFCLPAYDPIMMLLELDGRKDEAIEHLGDILGWAIHDDNLRFGTVINNSLAGLGRTCNSMAAEICLLLANRSDVDESTSKILIENGYSLVKDCVDCCLQKKFWHSLEMDNRVFHELETLAQSNKITL